VFEFAQRAFQSGEFPSLSREERGWIVSRYPNAAPLHRFRLRCRIAAVGDALRATETYFSTRGSFLDLGCGMGYVSHWLAREPGRRVLGVDASETSIRVALASERPSNLDFQLADVRRAFESDCVWNGIVLVDTLLYLDRNEQTRLIDRARERISTDGWLVIRDSTTEPRWKYRWTRLEERIKLHRWRYGIEQGDLALTYRSLDDWRNLIGASGWRIRLISTCGRWTPYPGWFAVCQAGG
jgi:SAM-dependent methyltransferase